MNNTTPVIFQISTDRLRSLCDVVMGVALVLLALNIDIPDLSSVTNAASLFQFFLSEFPAFFSFVISFLVIAKCWQIHNLLFYHVKQVDKRILWLTLFYLFSICLLVFTAGLPIHFEDKTIVDIFSLSLLLPALLLSLLCVRVVYLWQFDEEIEISEARKRAAVILMTKILLIPILALILIGISYYRVNLAYYLWALMFLVICV
ncbi:MAG: hypothetical protein ACD_29C00078G0001 [uncultured bacterium]|nr:MAG: hypothetical protein ACD_29C00078G0001 [uncultured bacterium]